MLRAMAAPDDFTAHVLELLAPLGATRARRMFGGAGVYLDGRFIAILADGMLYLKADALAQPQFAAAGCQPFAYTAAGGRRTVMAYWSAPEQAMESPAQMRPWALLALDSALRAAAAKRAAPPRKAAAKARQAGAGTAAAGGKAAARPRRG